MSRTSVVLAVGLCLAAAGAFLLIQAGALATRWEPAGPGAWGGATDPALRQALSRCGVAALALGAALAGMAAWHWLRAEPQGRPPVLD